MTALSVTAFLCGPAADYLPQLDSLLIEAAHHRLRLGRDRIPSRRRPAPDPLDVPPVPLARREIGGWPVFCCSSPIAATSPAGVSHFGKRIESSRAGLLSPGERKVLTTSNTWTKSYRLPLRVLTPDRVTWFVVGDAAPLRDLLRDVPNVGRKVAHGWGRVKRWLVEDAALDWSWYADDGQGRSVLMRPLPLCPELPEGLDGWRSGYGAVCPPYWHHDRLTERVEPA